MNLKLFNPRTFGSPFVFLVVVMSFISSTTWAEPKEDALVACLKLCKNFVWPLDAACQTGCSLAYLADKATCPSPKTARFDNSNGTEAGSEIMAYQPGVPFQMRAGVWDYNLETFVPEDPAFNNINFFIVPLEQFDAAENFDDIPWQSIPISAYDGFFWEITVDPNLLPTNEGYAFFVEMNHLQFGTQHGFTIANKQTAQAGAYFYGNFHAPMGNASLGVSPNGHLQVSNIGSSGLDGVSIDLGEADGLGVSFETMPDFSNPGAALQIEQIATTGNNVGSQSTAFTQNLGNGQYETTVDFPNANLQDVRLNAYQNGQLVYTADSINSFQSLTYWPYCGWRYRIKCVQFLWWRWYYKEWYWRSWWANTNYLINGETVQADEITIYVETQNEVDGNQQTVISTNGISDFVINDETLRSFDLDHQTPSVHFDNTNGGLIVSNIGSSGQDGVSIDLGEEAKEFSLVQEFDQPLSDGATLNYSSYGTFNGQSNQLLGITNLTMNGGNMVISSDFSSIGTTNFTVSVLNNGTEVCTLSSQNGVAAEVQATNKTRIEKYDRVTELPDGTVVKEGCVIYETAASIQLPDGSSCMGNVVMIRPDSPSADVAVLEVLQLDMSNTPAFTISNEQKGNANKQKRRAYINCLRLCQNAVTNLARFLCIRLCKMTYQSAKILCQSSNARFNFDPSSDESGTIQYIEDQPFSLSAGLYDSDTQLFMDDPTAILHVGFYAVPLEDVYNTPDADMLQWMPLGEGIYAGDGQYTFPFDPRMLPAQEGYLFRAEIIDRELNVEEDYTVALQRLPGFQATLFLHGPYDAASSLMHDDLRAQNFLPLDEPYSDLGYSYNPPLPTSGYSLAPEVLEIDDSTAIVDWLILELRDAVDPTIILGSRPGLLRRDGQIVDIDGRSTPTFEAVEGGMYYIAIQHRNHLPAMTANPVLVDGSLPSYDFSEASLHFSTQALKEINTGIYGMTSGDTDGNQQITASDRANAWNERNQTGYLSSDVDMTGSTSASDRAITWNHRNSTFLLP